MGRKLKIDTAAFEKKLRAVAEQAIQNTMKDEVIPKVKKKLSNKAKQELKNMAPKSSNAVLSADPEASKGYKKTTEGVRRVLSSESYIKSTDLQKNANSWNFETYYNVAPNDPLWNWNNGDANSISDNGELFAQWMVDGKLVIHPALSQYRGKILDGSNFNNPNYNAVEDEYTWQRYIKDYSFKQTPYVDHAIKELQKDKTFMSDIQKSISQKISKGMK